MDSLDRGMGLEKGGQTMAEGQALIEEWNYFQGPFLYSKVHPSSKGLSLNQGPIPRSNVHPFLKANSFTRNSVNNITFVL